MTGPRAALTAGTRLCYDGQLWEVAELAVPNVLLRDAAGGIRQVGIGHLLACPGTRLIDGGAQEAPEGLGVVLVGLDDAARHLLRERVAHVQEVRTGYQRGSAALALPGEPRPAYAAAAPMLERYRAKAAELGIGVSTLRRWVASFQDAGPAGLADDRWRRRQDPAGGADPRWTAMARVVLAEHTGASRPTQNIVLARIGARMEAEYGPGEVAAPSPTRARLVLREISKGSGAFGGTKTKRSIAGRPATPYGRLRPARPGEYLLVDTTPLDVFAMDPVTLQWVGAELTVAMDLYDRCVTGLRLTPVSTKAVDAAAVLFESLRPLPEPATGEAGSQPPYHGLPAALVVGAARLAGGDGRPLLPSVAAETVVVDHGRIYLSEHLLSVCARLGISVQPARVYQGSDKAALERFFRTLRESLLVALPGYKGPDVYSRGNDVEDQAFYFLDEMEQIIRRWVADCFHRQPHDGLCIPEVPGLALSPLEMFAHGITRAGCLQVPARADLVYDFLKVEWRTIQHYGVEIGGLRYDGQPLCAYRNQASSHGGRHAGKWPVRVDPGDVSKVYFQDPADNSWHTLWWEHAASLGQPFSAEALGYARRLAAARHRFPDTRRALADLLEQWDAGLARNPAERRMAVRLSEQRLRLVPGAGPDASAPLPLLPGTPQDPGLAGVAQPGAGHEPGLEGDDDTSGELNAPFPGEEDAGFYADAMDPA